MELKIVHRSKEKRSIEEKFKTQRIRDKNGRESIDEYFGRQTNK
jgi:hypothetical protein